MILASEGLIFFTEHTIQGPLYHLRFPVMPNKYPVFPLQSNVVHMPIPQHLPRPSLPSHLGTFGKRRLVTHDRTNIKSFPPLFLASFQSTAEGRVTKECFFLLFFPLV